MHPDFTFQGLDLTNFDATTTDEATAWRGAEYASRGYLLPGDDLLLEFRPDVVKRWAFIRPLVNNRLVTLSCVAFYVTEGFEEGVLYTIDVIERQGYGRGNLLDAIAIAALYSPAKGLHRMAPNLRKRLYAMGEPSEPVEWPEGWDFDRSVWDCGLDYSSAETTSEEVESIRQWYRRVTGEVPKFVDFLGEFHPGLLKRYRNRVEHALRASPNQLLPYTLILLESLRGQSEGIRDSVLLARGLGMTRQQTIETLAEALRFGGLGAISMADAAAGEVLRNW
jgi:hypothetical protein